MIYFFVVIIVAGVFDIWKMSKKKLNKEIAVYSVFTLLTAGLGLFYYSNPLRRSFADIMLGLLGLNN